MSAIKNVTTLVFGKGINLIINILFMPYLARTLSTSDYGTYGQTLMVVDIVKTLFSGGLAIIIFVYLSNAIKKKEVISSNFFLSVLLGLIGCFATLMFSGQLGLLFDNENLSSYINIYALSLLISVPNTVLFSLLIYYKKIKIYTKIIVFINILRLVFLLFSIQLLHSLNAVFISFVLLELIQFIILFVGLKTRISLSHFIVQTGIKQFKKGFYINLASLLGFLTLTTDSVMISIFENEEEFAFYKNGAFEIPLISVLYVSISQIFLPKISLWFANKEFAKIANIKKELSSNIAAVTYPVCIFFVFFSSEFILIYLSDRYTPSAIIFTIFNLSLIMRIYDYLDVLIAAKKTRLILFVQIFAILFNFILNYILISEWGIKGAAIATLTTLFCYAFILLHFNSKTLNTSLSKIIDIPKVTLILLISLILVIPFNYISLPNHLFLSFVIKFLYFPITYFTIIKCGFLDPKITLFFKQKINNLFNPL